MALPSTNISIRLVKETLGVASNDVGELCISGNINKWSKHKPFQSTVPFYNTVADMETDMQSESGSLSNYVHRFGLRVYYSILDFGFLSEYNEAWKYDKPVALYRLGDFRQYDHAATSPVPYIISSSYEINVEQDEGEITGHEYKATIRIKVPANNHDLKLSEIKLRYNGSDIYLSQCKLCLWIRDSEGGSPAVTETDSVLGDSFGQELSVDVGVDFNQLDVDSYMIPILQYGSTALRVQLENMNNIYKFAYRPPFPRPAIIYAWHTEEPSWTWSQSEQTMEVWWKINVKNSGDLTSPYNTRVFVRLTYNVRQQDFELISDSPLGGHDSISRHGRTTCRITEGTAGEQPEVIFYYINQNGQTSLVNDYQN